VFLKTPKLLSRMRVRPWRIVVGATMAICWTALVPASSGAAISTFGSPLTVPATLDTASNLAYQAMHSGSDTALWNVNLPGGLSAAPTVGLLLKVEIEGCAVPSPEGPAPLTQFHIQSLVPTSTGATVAKTSQPFDVPVCGVAGASGATISSYQPSNFCIAQGEYIAFNDEGGYVAGAYPAGVPYRVMASAAGATLDSFIGSSGNGAELSSSIASSVDGFATNGDVELLLRATLGTGSDGAPGCGGSAPPPPPSVTSPRTSLPNVGLTPQTDGINRRGVVSVAIFCHLKPHCEGTATLSIPKGTTIRQRIKGGHGHRTVSIAGTYGQAEFAIATGKTAHIPMHVGSKLVKLARRPGGVSVVLTALVGGQRATQKITVKV
jgi:hypothetical protein